MEESIDADPIDRKKLGIKPNYVIIDLEFNKPSDAANTHDALRKLWAKVEGSVMTNPQTRFFDVVETIEL